jgi:GNAT superfamily N-acetyltransferase
VAALSSDDPPETSPHRMAPPQSPVPSSTTPPLPRQIVAIPTDVVRADVEACLPGNLADVARMARAISTLKSAIRTAEHTFAASVDSAMTVASTTFDDTAHIAVTTTRTTHGTPACGREIVDLVMRTSIDTSAASGPNAHLEACAQKVVDGRISGYVVRATERGALVGACVVAASARDVKLMTVEMMCVESPSHGRGIGTRMWAEMETHLGSTRIVINKAACLLHAKPFWLARGFVEAPGADPNRLVLSKNA